MFKPLTKSEIRSIVDMQLQHLQALLRKQDITIKLTDYAMDELANLGYDPHYGARPLKRVIQKNIMDNLSKMILDSKFDPQKTIIIDVIDDQFVMYPDSEK